MRACPVSDGEWGLVGCARLEFRLIRPDGTPAVGVHLSPRFLPPPATIPNASALPTDSTGRTRLQVNWEVLPLPTESRLRVVAIRLDPAAGQVHALDTLDVIARSAPAGQRPETGSITWQLERW